MRGVLLPDSTAYPTTESAGYVNVGLADAAAVG